jgi:putative transposase
MSIAERREAVRFLGTQGVSVQRACVLVQLQRASFQYQPRSVADDGVESEIAALAQAHPRYGYRRVWALLRRKRTINRKRVHRLWKRARLQVQRPIRRRQRRARPLPLAAAYPNHVWAYDFVEDQDVHGRILRMLTVMDEFTREGLAIDVDTSTSAERVIGVLLQLAPAHGTPAYLRSDNGSEFVAVIVQAWLAQRQIQTLYIDPGCPWQNGKDERFNGTVRDECLNMHLFASVAEARVRLEAFRRHYNDDRPHSRLGYQTPSEFKHAWLEAQANQPDSHIST